MPKLLILALLIGALVSPIGGKVFASKKVLRNRGGEESGHKRASNEAEKQFDREQRKAKRCWEKCG